MSCPLGRAVTECVEERGELRVVPGGWCSSRQSSVGGGCCPASLLLLRVGAAMCYPPIRVFLCLLSSFSCKDFCEQVSCGAFSSFQALLHAEFILTPSKDGAQVPSSDCG